jgi:hypothetical protein
MTNRAIPNIPKNDAKESNNPKNGMRRRGEKDVPKIALTAYGAVTNGLKLDFPATRAGLSYSIPKV